ncbi:hypothetical protein HED60_16445 [Planctomycetales bacterium ZRK34]|nr:hypothetical protein HED60_16445 [Planctomycetales bacterium ZRK34]
MDGMIHNMKQVTEDDAVILPQWSGGKLDPYGGVGGRVKDLRKFEALVEHMRIPIMLSLTIDRDAYDSPAEAFDQVTPKVSRLLSERLGVGVWARVIEPQTKSGDGWIHWHVLLDLGCTRFEKRRGWASLRQFNAAVRASWCDRWGVAQRGGIDTQLARSRKGIVGYIAKYLVKPWPAIPCWLLSRSMVRLVGFSKRANQLLRQSGLLTPRVEPRVSRRCVKRPIRPLLERIAESGLCSKVIRGGRWLGKIRGSVKHLIFGESVGLPISLKVSTYKGLRGVVERVNVVLNDATTAGITQVERWLAGVGLMSEYQQEYERRLRWLPDAWSEMQRDLQHA